MLKPTSIRCGAAAGSKKRALDLLSEMLAEGAGDLAPADLLEGLAARERLGSTGLGRAIAMPHARLPGVESSAAAFLKLASPVDFDSPDGQGVDLLLGLLLPDTGQGENGTGDLGEIARRLGDSKLQERLRNTSDPAVLHAILVQTLSMSSAASADEVS